MLNFPFLSLRHTLSITSSPSTGLLVSNYAAAHCAPMTAPTSQDPPSLKETRLAIRKFLGELLRKE